MVTQEPHAPGAKFDAASLFLAGARREGLSEALSPPASVWEWGLALASPHPLAAGDELQARKATGRVSAPGTPGEKESSCGEQERLRILSRSAFGSTPRPPLLEGKFGNVDLDRTTDMCLCCYPRKYLGEESVQRPQYSNGCSVEPSIPEKLLETEFMAPKCIDFTRHGGSLK